MRAAIDTEPAPSVAPGLGAGNHPRASIASTAFTGLPTGNERYDGWQTRYVQQTTAPVNLDNLIRERSASGAVTAA
jgi:hypothetical protein